MGKSEIQPLRLRRSEAGSVVLLPEFLGRVRAFLERFDPSVDQMPVLDAIWRDFGADSGYWLLIAFVADGRMVGHLLAGLSAYYSQRVAVVYQFEHDDGLGDAWQAAIAAEEMLEVWAERAGCRSITCFPSSESRSRLFRRAGYRPVESRMVKELLGGRNG